MSKLKHLGITLLMVVSAVNFTACNNQDDKVPLPVDNTLALMIGTWEGTGKEEGSSFTFNSDGTYVEQDGEFIINGTFEYYPDRYMFVTYYPTQYGDENIIYTVVKINNEILVLNNNGHSNIMTFKRK